MTDPYPIITYTDPHGDRLRFAGNDPRVLRTPGCCCVVASTESGVALTPEQALDLAGHLLAASEDSRTSAVLVELVAERIAQHAKWGEQNHPDGTGGPGSRHLADWARAVCKAKDPDTFWKILLEEVYEAGAESDPEKLRTELIQVAAVAVQWIEAIDRRVGKAVPTAVGHWPDRKRCISCGEQIPDGSGGLDGASGSWCGDCLAVAEPAAEVQA